jgi:Ca2+-binding EF-hand superfamily protein
MFSIRTLPLVAFLACFASLQRGALADEQLDRELAKLLDANKDGEVTEKEVEKGLPQIGARANANDEAGRKLRGELDKNNDGRVDAEEAKEAANRGRALANAENFVAELFRKFDKNNDAALSEEEFDRLLKVIGDENPEAAKKLSAGYRLMDRNNDGKVTRQEISTVLELIKELGGGKKPQAEQPDPSADAKIAAHAEKTLKELDADGNGSLSRREAAKNKRLAGVFRTVDADGDGELTPAEMTAFLKRVAAAAGAGKE